MKPPSRGLADLRPNATIACFWCREPRPSAGAVKFRSHHVCAECAAKLQAQKPDKPKH